MLRTIGGFTAATACDPRVLFQEFSIGYHVGDILNPQVDWWSHKNPGAPVNDTVNFSMGRITLSGNAQGSWRWNTTSEDENSGNLQQHFIANKEFRTKAYSIATAVALVPGDGP